MNFVQVTRSESQTYNNKTRPFDILEEACNFPGAAYH